MALFEIILSSVKLAAMFFLLLVFCIYLVYKLMAGTSAFFYERGKVFYGKEYAYKDAVKVSSKFKPIFKKIRVRPSLNSIEVEGVFTPKLKFKRKLRMGDLRHEIFYK